MGVWDEILHTPALNGVPFDLERRQVRGGPTFARHRFPFRPGQEVEDTGRKPYRFDLVIPLFASIDPEDYPGRFEQIRRMIDSPDTKGEVEYTDPILGPLPVKVVDYDWTDSFEARDGARLHLVLEERSTEPFIATDFEDTDPKAKAETSAATVDAEMADAGISEDDLATTWSEAGVPLVGLEISFPAGGLFLHLTDAYFDTLEASALAADDIAALVDTYRYRVDLLLRTDPLVAAGGWTLRRAAMDVMDSWTRAAEAIFASRPPVVSWTVPRRMSSIEIAVTLYGDPGRREEIERRNRTRNPLFYPQGVELRVLAA